LGGGVSARSESHAKENAKRGEGRGWRRPTGQSSSCWPRGRRSGAERVGLFFFIAKWDRSSQRIGASAVCARRHVKGVEEGLQGAPEHQVVRFSCRGGCATAWEAAVPKESGACHRASS
jgi:hypothetical protein